MNIKPWKDGVPDKPQQSRYGKIILCDHSGDTPVATFEPGVDNDAITVAQDQLTAFLADCVKRHNQHPPVFGKRLGAEKYTPFRVGDDAIVDVETIVIQRPLVGG